MPQASSQSATGRRSNREVRFGAYLLGSTLGEGEFGKVKLGFRRDGRQPYQVAIKLIKRESIPRNSERESKVHREINALKKLSHPNIVKLEEVLQNDKYVGIVLDYASGGELFDYIYRHKHLKDFMASKLFAQLVSGVDYMHSKHIVHRDLKLENLLLDNHKNIIITDFGFVNSFTNGNELMKTSCGSPCYAAPELVLKNEPYEARKVDVWSCGVILYAMLAGYLPFDDDPDNPEGTNISKLYNYISNTELTFPEYVQALPRNLLRNILVPEPKYRYSLKQVRQHSWLAPHAAFLSVTPEEWDRNAQFSRQAAQQSTTSNATSQQQPASADAQRNSKSPQIPHSATTNSISSGAHAASRANVSRSGSTRHSGRRQSSGNKTNRYSMVEPTTSSFVINNNSQAAMTPIEDQDSFNGSAQSQSNKSASEMISMADKRNSVYSDYSSKVEKYKPVVSPRSGPARNASNSSTSHTAAASAAAAVEAASNNSNTSKTGTISNRSNKNNQKLPGPDPKNKPRPSSYHPGLLPDGPLNADFSFLMPQLKNGAQVSTTKSTVLTVPPPTTGVPISPIKSAKEEEESPTKKALSKESASKEKLNGGSAVLRDAVLLKDGKKTATTSQTFGESKERSGSFASPSVVENIFVKKTSNTSSQSPLPPVSSPTEGNYEIITNGAPPSPVAEDSVKTKRNSKYGTLTDAQNFGLPKSQSTKFRSESGASKKRFSIFGSFTGSEEVYTNEKFHVSSNYHKTSKSISFGRRSSAATGLVDRSSSNGALKASGLDSNQSSPTKPRVRSVIITNGNYGGRKRSESISTTRKFFDFFRRKSPVKSSS